MWPFSPKARTARAAGRNSGGLKPLGVEALEDRVVPDNTLGTATNFGPLPGQVSKTGFVGSTDTNDYYRMYLSPGGTLNLSLTGLTADADLQVIWDADGSGAVDPGEVIASSVTGGTASESINVWVAAGVYFVRVYRHSGDTNYTLRLTDDRAGNTIGTARNVSAPAGATDVRRLRGGGRPERLL